MPSQPNAPLSELRFSLPRTVYEQTSLSGRFKDVPIPAHEVIRQSLGLRHFLEQVRDGLVSNIPLTPRAASDVLDANNLASRSSIEHLVSEGEKVSFKIQMPPGLLSVLDERYKKEGFDSIDEYIGAALILHHTLEGPAE